MSAMDGKKTWIEPEIEEVALESEDEVLATCYTASMNSRKNGGCHIGACATYP